jgi:hypothetical protein
MAEIDEGIGVDNTRSNGDGDKDTKKLDSFIDSDTFGGIFTSHQLASAIEKFVERGETVEDLIIRGDFRTVTYKNSAMRLRRKAKHFHDPELTDLILNAIAGDVAIGGKRIDILKQAVVGQLENERKRNMGNRIRGWLGGDTDNGKGK